MATYEIPEHKDAANHLGVAIKHPDGSSEGIPVTAD
jgi:hypothetical protein